MNIKSSLVLDTRLVIWHELNFLKTNKKRDPNNVLSSTRKSLLESVQHPSRALYLSPIEICHNKVLYFPKNTYLKCGSRFLSSNIGVFPIEGFAGRHSQFFIFISNSSFFDFNRNSHLSTVATNSSSSLISHLTTLLHGPT